MPACCTDYRTSHGQPVFLCTTTLVCWFRWCTCPPAPLLPFLPFKCQFLFLPGSHLYMNNFSKFLNQYDRDHFKLNKHSCTMTGRLTLSWFSSLTCCGTVIGNCSSGITWSSSIFHLGWKDEIWSLDVQATLKVQKYKSNQNTNNSQQFKRLVVLLMEETLYQFT